MGWNENQGLGKFVSLSSWTNDDDEKADAHDEVEDDNADVKNDNDDDIDDDYNSYTCFFEVNVRYSFSH